MAHLIVSKFFNEVEFEMTPSPASQKPAKVVVWDKTKLDAAFEEITQELIKIKGGVSEFVPRAIDSGKFGFPAMNAIKIFLSDPSDKTFEGIPEITRQDWGARAGNHFTALLKAAREVKDNVRD